LNDVIKYLSINHEIAIVTTNSFQNVSDFLTRHGLNHLIHAVYGVDSPGSKAQKFAFARDRFVTNTGQESVFVVGDSSSDILAAKEASVTSIAITWAHQSLKNLFRWHPDFVVNSPRELIDVIEQ
jgi:phosphoglycolate phosphatase-like HAD superfamily hydrolase